MMPGSASSHREAPLISGDPQVDNTDVYAFVSPDEPDMVTLIATWIPFEDPAGGPNFYFFDPSARYEIKVDNDGDAVEDLVVRWEFTSEYRNPNTFLYNTGPVTSLNDPDLNFRQTYVLTILEDGAPIVVGGPFPVPPVNVGTPSTPSFGGHFTGIQGLRVPGGTGRVVAGQFDDPFFLDLRVFNLLYGADLSQVGTDTLAGFNVHATVIQLPTTFLTGAEPVIGVWSSADRRAMTVRSPGGESASGEWVQVSRLGMPLVNEVVIPVGKKDIWNGSEPSGDGQFLDHVVAPELARLLEAVYGIPAAPTPRQDLISVFLTGLEGLNQPTAVTPSEQLRLNTSIPPSGVGHRLGVLGGDLAGFPNGRRLADDVLDIEVRVVAGQLVGNPNELGDGVDANDRAFGEHFPYLALPHAGSTAASLTTPRSES